MFNTHNLRAAMIAAAATLLLVASILIGSRNLGNFDPALIAYLFGCIFACFGVVYRYTVWLQRPPTWRYFARGRQLFFTGRTIAYAWELVKHFVVQFLGQLGKNKQVTRLIALGFLLLPALFILNLDAETVTNSPVADTTLFEPNPTHNLGGHFDVSAGTTLGGPRARGLFRFDSTGQIPLSATITSVSLRLRVTKVPTGGGVASVFELRRVLQPWGEGNKTSSQGGVASVGEASWNDRLTGTAPWTIPGGQIGADFSSTFSATAPVSGLGNVTFDSVPGLIADVQAWVANAGTNFGWVLMSQSEDQHETARRFASREDSNHAPQLVIEYSLNAAEFRITNISLNQTTGTVVWAGGKEPFQLQSKTNLNETNWVDVGQPTLTSSATFPVGGSASFFRVADVATLPTPATTGDETTFESD